MSTLETRIKEAAVVLNSYFKDSKKSAEETIALVLNYMGITNDDFGLKILEASSTVFDDFQKSDWTGVVAIPIPRLKIAWSILKGQDPFKMPEQNTETFSSNSDITAVVKQLKPIGQWSDAELVEQYGKNCPMQVEDELSKRSKDRPCMIFNEDNASINKEISLILLREARHCPTPSTYLVDKKLYQVYKIGEFPMNVMYECPIHSNVLLVNGYCEDCGQKWSTDDSELHKNVFLRMISETTRIEPITLKMYMQQSFEDLIGMFPKILLKFNALKEEGKLPTLKRRISKAREGDPFRVVHKEY